MPPLLMPTTPRCPRGAVPTSTRRWTMPHPWPFPRPPRTVRCILPDPSQAGPRVHPMASVLGMDAVTAARVDRVSRSLAGLGSVLVAFSGGADSAFLVAAAVRALGRHRVLAVTAVSASLPAVERAA